MSSKVKQPKFGKLINIPKSLLTNKFLKECINDNNSLPITYGTKKKVIILYLQIVKKEV